MEKEALTMNEQWVTLLCYYYALYLLWKRGKIREAYRHRDEMAEKLELAAHQWRVAKAAYDSAKMDSEPQYLLCGNTGVTSIIHAGLTVFMSDPAGYVYQPGEQVFCYSYNPTKRKSYVHLGFVLTNEQSYRGTSVDSLCHSDMCHVCILGAPAVLDRRCLKSKGILTPHPNLIV